MQVGDMLATYKLSQPEPNAFFSMYTSFYALQSGVWSQM